MIGKDWTDHSNGNEVFLITASCSIAVKVLAYQSEGHGFKSRWSLGIFLSFFYNFQFFIIMNLVPQGGASLPIMWNIKMESYLYHLRQNTLISTEWYLKSFIYCHLLRKNRFRSSVYKLPVCRFFFGRKKVRFLPLFARIPSIIFCLVTLKQLSQAVGKQASKYVAHVCQSDDEKIASMKIGIRPRQNPVLGYQVRIKDRHK